MSLCGGKRACEDNCLETINPSLADEWHPIKNVPLTPKDVVPGSNKQVWWQCRKNSTHEWPATIDSRHGKKNGCPYCSNKRVNHENCLAATNRMLAAEWHPTKNDPLTPFKVTAGSQRKVWWRCAKDNTHEWAATIDSRKRGNGCRYCSGQQVHPSNCLAVTHPHLATEWHPTKNGPLTPYDFTRGSKKVKIWWVCPQRHEYPALILTRTHGHGCPECARVIKRMTALKRWENVRQRKVSLIKG